MKSNTKTFGKDQKPTNQPCVKMSTDTARHIGLGGAICVIIGAMMGTGIFFKNKSVFNNNDGNPYGVLLSWGLAFIIAIATAYTYGEISRCKTKAQSSGLAGWAERYVGYNHGRFLKIIYPLFDYPVKTVAIAVFCAEAVLNINPSWAINKIDCHFGFVILISIAILAILLTINYLSATFAPKFSKGLVYSKFIPLSIIIIGGIVFGCMSSEHNLFVNPEQSTSQVEWKGIFSFTGVLNSLPGIMFAFDSFLIVGNIAKDVKSPTKNIPLSILLSMTIAGSVYMIVTICQICSGAGDPFTLFNYLFGENQVGKKIIIILFSTALFICMFDAMNSHVLTGVGAGQAAIDEDIIVGSNFLRKISNGKHDKFGGVVLMTISYSIVAVLLAIPSLILKTDQFYDGITNTLVVFIFLNYGFIALMSLVNRFTKRVPESEVSYQKGQSVAAIISFIGCLFVACYGLFYQFLADPIMNPNEEFKSWGLFYNNKTFLTAGLTKLTAAIFFWGASILLFSFCFIHDLILKKIRPDYPQPLLWQRSKENTLSK